jgi:omega-amidase
VDGGALVALHRKVHLFDIDIPGKIMFKVRPLILVLQPLWYLSYLQESETLTGGATTNYFDTGTNIIN